MRAAGFEKEGYKWYWLFCSIMDLDFYFFTIHFESKTTCYLLIGFCYDVFYLKGQIGQLAIYQHLQIPLNINAYIV